jgi:hypothetical protein
MAGEHGTITFRRETYQHVRGHNESHKRMHACIHINRRSCHGYTIADCIDQVGWWMVEKPQQRDGPACGPS